ncbi:GAF domain-containing sensor histidine kinase [Pontibacter sp. CAU 1760]
MILTAPIPENEFERVLDLTELDLDYSNLDEKFKDLTKLAARVAGTEISLLNLIDSFTQWTVSGHGFEVTQMDREESVCQYTIMNDAPFEVKDLTLDERFKDKEYVTAQPHLKFYFGIPLRTNKGHNIGALCVLDSENKTLNPEKIELLKIIADEIVNRLMMVQAIHSLNYNLNEAKEVKKRVAHDIRGPIGGIIGLAQLITKRGEKNKLDDVLQFINMIQKSGTSLLELADEILNAELQAATKTPELKEHELNLLQFKDKLEKLYTPQAKNKNINFAVAINPENGVVPFPKNKLLQISGNLISNAIKFTPPAGRVSVDLDLDFLEGTSMLHIQVKDSGVGLAQENIDKILTGASTSTNGTKGEQGYGFGLPLVKYLIDGLNGTMDITSTVGEGTQFDIRLPVC